MFTRYFNDLFENFLRIQCAGRIIGIDDDDGLRSIGDLGTYVLNIRILFGFLITGIMYRCAAGQIYAGRPQRIVWRRDQHFIAIVKQGRQ